MMRIAKPVLDPLNTFQTCISRVQDEDLKTRLVSIEQHIVHAADEFDAAAERAEWYLLQAHDTVDGKVTRQEMSSVYEDRMVDQRAPGRPIYDILIKIPRHERCPMCAQRTVSTLDHYLPRKFYPSLAVVPLNLVACCRDCNTVKLAVVPSRDEEQTLHPYYDDISGQAWLAAKVLEDTPASLQFHIQLPPGADPILHSRITRHFEVFKLAALYVSHGAGLISNNRGFLRDLFNRAGVNGVKAHLASMADSCANESRNSWETASYTALAASEWFCEGGFALE